MSVIIPVYNAGKYLKKCVESILKQSEKKFELILIDDGSDDGSDEICDMYAEVDNRINVIHQDNRGASVARNVGIKAAKGDYIVFVDADDWVDPDYLADLLIEMRPGGLAVSNFVRDDKSQDKVGKRILMNKEQAEISTLSYEGIQGYLFAKMFDLEIIRKNNVFYDEEVAICEGVLFVIQYLSLTTAQTVWIEKASYHYRSNPTGALNGRYEKKEKLEKRILSEFSAIEKATIFAKKNQR